MKKKVVIFSSRGGGGHISVANAVTDYIQYEYEVSTIYIFDELLGIIDPIKIMSLGFSNGEHFYNALLKRKWTRALNLLYAVARVSLPLIYPVIRKLIYRFLDREAPDCVISVVPIVNNSIKECCRELHMLFLLIPTDLDISTFIYNIKRPFSKTLHLALAFDDSMIWKKLDKVEISHFQISITGFPIKSSFLEPKNIKKLKQAFEIPEDKKVIMVLMGAAGSQITINYFKTLAKLPFPTHLLICLGRSEELRQKIEKLNVSSHITYHLIGQTDRIADLMAVSDLLITKAGTVSVVEGIYMNIPMILDNTSTPLTWEKFNLTFIEEHQFGLINNRFKTLNKKVSYILQDSTYYTFLKNNLAYYPKKLFAQEIKDLLYRMINFP